MGHAGNTKGNLISLDIREITLKIETLKSDTIRPTSPVFYWAIDLTIILIDT